MTDRGSAGVADPIWLTACPSPPWDDRPVAYFDVSADAYVRFMGRFSTHLSEPFAELGLAGVAEGARVLDVGCGPGMLTAELVRRQGEALTAAVDPVESFVSATASSYPSADVRRATAEDLPFADGEFAAVLAQLVVHFLSDPVAGLREMARVTVPGGRVSACVWDHAGGAGPLSTFWDVARRVDPATRGEGHLPGTRQGELVDLFGRAGLRDVRGARLEAPVRFATFDEWWEPFTYGVGPAGQHVADLDASGRDRLVSALREELGDGPFQVGAAAWAASGVT